MKKILFNSRGLIVFICFFICIPVFSQSESRPNILFIIADDLGKYLPVYGNAQVSAPTIETLAREGMVFDRAYCNFPLCGPSRASMLSGIYPETMHKNSGKGFFTKAISDNQQVRGAARNTNPRLKTMLQYIKDEGGYYVMGGGKLYHKSESRVTPDFSRVVNVNSRPAYSYNANNLVLVEDTQYEKDSDHRDGLLANKLVGQIEQYSKGEIGNGKPLFISMGFTKPHGPFAAPRKYFRDYPISPSEIEPISFFDQPNDINLDWALSGARQILGRYDKDMGLNSDNYVDIDKGILFSNLKPELQKRVTHAYYTCISFIDAQIKKVVDALKDNGLYDNTLIVITSDHGYKLGEYDRMGKYSVQEPDSAIPLIVSGPNVAENKRSSSIAQLIDIYPTLCEATSTPIPDWCEGTSLMPIFNNPENKVNDYAYTIVKRGGEWIAKSIINDKSIRFSKYIRGSDGTFLEPPGKELSQEIYDYSESEFSVENHIFSPLFTEDVSNLSNAIDNFFQTGYYAKTRPKDIYEAEEAELVGTAEVRKCSSFSEGEAVRRIQNGNDGENAVVFDHVNVDNSGQYDLTLSYISTNPTTMKIEVNNVVQMINVPATGRWCYQGGSPGTHPITINLNSGMNIIKVYNSPALDKIELESSDSSKQVFTAISNSQLVVYPNHVTKGDFIRVTHFNAEGEISDLEHSVHSSVINISGKTIFKKTYNQDDRVEIPTYGLERGLYFLRLRVAGKAYVQRILIE